MRLVVLSGGPCAGKSTLAQALWDLGHGVVREAAGDLIAADGGRLRGRDPLEFQRRVFALQLEREREARESGSATGVVVADRGLGDNFGYLRLRGIPPFPELEAARPLIAARYAVVLFLAQHPDYSTAAHRFEAPDEARRIHELLRECWEGLHPRVVDIAWSTPTDRLADAVQRIAETTLAADAGEGVS